MGKSNKQLFKRLNKMPLTQRVQTVTSPAGQSILGALTPSEFSQLFPKYYERGLPDVSGFRLATTRAAQERQKEASLGILDRIGKMEKRGEEMASEIYHKLKRKLGFDKGVADLTPDQLQAFERLKAGGLSVNSEQGRMFTKLTPAQLKSIGVDIVKDNTGREVFEYRAPAPSTEEEAISRLKSSSSTGFTGREKAVLDMISKREGATDPNTIFGGNKYKAAVGYNKPLTEMTINEVIEMQKRMTKVTAADGVAGGKGTSAVGSGQFVRDTLIQNLKRLGISEDQWDKVKFDQALQQKITIQNFRDTVGDPNNPGSWNLQKLGAQWESFDTRKGFAPLKSTEISAVLQASTDKPVSPTEGKFSKEEITKMMQQMDQEKDVTRKHALANILANAGVPTAELTGTPSGGPDVKGTDKWSSVQPLGSVNFCGRGVADLASKIYGDKYFSGHLGTEYASDLSYGKRSNNIFSNSGLYKAGQQISKDALTPEFLAKLPPGTIVSAGGGGRADGAGHIQMKVGDRWASDHWQHGFSFRANRVNGNYQDFVIHYPSDAGLKVLQERGYVSSVSVASKPIQEPVPNASSASAKDVEVEFNKSNVSKETIEKENKMVEERKQTATVNGPTVPAKVSSQQPTAEVKSTDTRFKFDKESFLNEVGVKHPMAYSFVGPGREGVWSQTVQGLKEAESKGVLKYNEKTGELVIKDMKNPEVQKVLQDMKDNQLDRGTFMKEVKQEPPKEKKVEAPPTEPRKIAEAPTETKKVTEPPKPQPTPEQSPTIKQFVKGEGYAGIKEVPNPNYVSPKQETKPANEPPKVGTAQTGGSFGVPDGGIEAYPIGGIKNDNTVVVNKNQQPLFTMNSNEAAVYDPSQSKVDVLPSQKADGNKFGPSADNTRDEIHQLRQEMNSALAEAGNRAMPAQPREVQPIRNDNPNFVQNLLDQNKRPWNNPAFERAMNRTRMFESGDTLNNHFSTNNTNG